MGILLQQWQMRTNWKPFIGTFLDDHCWVLHWNEKDNDQGDDENEKKKESLGVDNDDDKNEYDRGDDDRNSKALYESLGIDLVIMTMKKIMIFYSNSNS